MLTYSGRRADLLARLIGETDQAVDFEMRASPPHHLAEHQLRLVIIGGRESLKRGGDAVRRSVPDLVSILGHPGDMVAGLIWINPTGIGPLGSEEPLRYLRSIDALRTCARWAGRARSLSIDPRRYAAVPRADPTPALTKAVSPISATACFVSDPIFLAPRSGL